MPFSLLWVLSCMVLILLGLEGFQKQQNSVNFSRVNCVVIMCIGMSSKNSFRPSTIKSRKNVVMDNALYPFVLLYAEKHDLYLEEAVTRLLANALVMAETEEIERREQEMDEIEDIPEVPDLRDY